MILWELFVAFFKVGILSFGGGYASMPIIIEQAITKHHWINMSTFTDLFTISQMTPGPIAINGSTFVGEAAAGMPGAIIATIGCVLPSAIIVSFLAYLYVRYEDLTIMDNALAFLRPAVVAMIAISGITILLEAFFIKSTISLTAIKYHAIVVFVICLVLLRKYKWNPVLVMFLAGLSEVIIQYIF